MSIDPKLSFYFGIWTSILLLVASGGISFDGALPAAYVPMITKWCAILGAINSTILTGMSGYSSNKAGPLTSAPSAGIPPTLVRILIGAFLLSLFLASGSGAMAQSPRVRLQPQGPALTGDLIRDLQPQSGQSERAKLGCDPLNLKPGCKTAKATDDIKNLSDAMSPEMKDFVTFVQGDIDTAIKLTGLIEDLPDGNGQACFAQLRKSADIITSLQKTVDSDGVIGAVTAYEALRLLHMNVIKTCENTACTQIFSEVTNVVTSATPAPFSLQVPSITKLCAKIPAIAMKPVTALAPPAVPPAQ